MSGTILNTFMLKHLIFLIFSQFSREGHWALVRKNFIGSNHSQAVEMNFQTRLIHFRAPAGVSDLYIANSTKNWCNDVIKDILKSALTAKRRGFF